MYPHEVTESDWKLFRKKLPGWQEAYMDKLNQEYIQLLTGTGDASDKFWELEKSAHYLALHYTFGRTWCWRIFRLL